MLCWSPVMYHTLRYPPQLAFWFTRIPVELCVSAIHKVFWCRCRYSNSLVSLKLAKTLICFIVTNTFLANHMLFHASIIGD